MRDPSVRSVALKRDDVDFNRYPFSIPAIRNLSELELDPHVTLIAGENGSGKSTLVEAIAVPVGFNAEGGSRHMRVATRESHSALHERLQLVRGSRSPKTGYLLRARRRLRRTAVSDSNDSPWDCSWSDLDDRDRFLHVSLRGRLTWCEAAPRLPYAGEPSNDVVQLLAGEDDGGTMSVVVVTATSLLSAAP